MVLTLMRGFELIFLLKEKLLLSLNLLSIYNLYTQSSCSHICA